MASSLPFAPLALSLCLLVLLPTLGFCKPQDKIFMHHGGPMLNDNINLYLFWYGKFAPVELESVRGFIESLNAPTEKKMKPSVGTWWNMVESYQKALVKKQKFSPRIGVRVVGQGFDQQYQQGKVITQDYVNKLHKESSMPNVKNTVFVLITAKDVTLHGSCLDRCALHGNFDSPGKELFIVVNNPEKECPQKCTWPFVKHYTVKSSVALRPPSGNIGADSLVMNLAGALAATVTNPYRNGWYQGPFFKQTEAAVFCAEMFGTGARPGYPGKTQFDKFTGGAFNAHGVRGKTFLLPALWNPVKKQCWTLM